MNSKQNTPYIYGVHAAGTPQNYTGTAADTCKRLESERLLLEMARQMRSRLPGDIGSALAPQRMDKRYSFLIKKIKKNQTTTMRVRTVPAHGFFLVQQGKKKNISSHIAVFFTTSLPY